MVDIDDRNNVLRRPLLLSYRMDVLNLARRYYNDGGAWLITVAIAMLGERRTGFKRACRGTRGIIMGHQNHLEVHQESRLMYHYEVDIHI